MTDCQCHNNFVRCRPKRARAGGSRPSLSSLVSSLYLPLAVECLPSAAHRAGTSQMIYFFITQQIARVKGQSNLATKIATATVLYSVVLETNRFADNPT